MTFKKTMTAMMTLIAAMTMTCCVSNTDNAEYSPTPNMESWREGERQRCRDIRHREVLRERKHFRQRLQRDERKDL